MEKNWRLIIDEPKDGFYNMAKDEAMCMIYQKTKIPILRIYSWDKPTISIGYSQKLNSLINFKNCFKKNTSFVRRITGGAAILHSNEFTYSLVFGKDDLKLSKGVKDSYRDLNAFIINFYKSLGLDANFAIDKNKESISQYGNHCFSTKEDFDIVINDKKIGGNAQRRFREFVFQHGSIPKIIDFGLTRDLIFGVDANLEEKITFLEKLNLNLNSQEFCDFFVKSFTACFNSGVVNDNFSEKEEKLVESLILKKYKTKEWNVSDEEVSMA